MSEFTEKTPTLDNYWRSIILFGRNVASYKFALSKSLLELRDRKNDLITLEELADPFSRHICEHIKHSPKQSTSSSSNFLNACVSYNNGGLSHDDLISRTKSLGFNNVIDAFHVVNQGDVPERFFMDERKENGGIRLTDNLFKLFDDKQSNSLQSETEARWRLVETAWDLNISRNLINIEFDAENNQLFTKRGERNRVAVTSCRDALNGYQKGKCFYCYTNVSVVSGDADLSDVDHFFPNVLKSDSLGLNIDGVWNLVLACQSCNRGPSGKFAKLPTVKLLVRLNARNEFLIGSHHPLRETLIQQTGKTREARKSFMQYMYDQSIKTLIHTWEPEQQAGDLF